MEKFIPTILHLIGALICTILYQFLLGKFGVFHIIQIMLIAFNLIMATFYLILTIKR